MNQKNNVILEEVRKIISNNGNGNGRPTTEVHEEETEVDLKDLRAQIKPGEISLDDLREKAKKNSETVFASAADYVKICRGIDQLLLMESRELVLSGAMERLRALKSEKNRIENLFGRLEKEVQDQFSVDLLIHLLNTLNPESEKEVSDLIELILSGGLICSQWNKVMRVGKRARLATREEDEYLTLKAKSQEGLSKQEKNEIVYFSCRDKRYILFHIPSQLLGREGQVSGADRQIFRALRGLIFRFRKSQNERREAFKKDQDELLMKLKLGKNEHSLTSISHGVCGTYFLYVPGQNGLDGAAQIEVRDLNARGKDQQPFHVIRLIDGAGSMEIFGHNNGSWFRLGWFKYYLKNKATHDSVPESMVNLVSTCCRWIHRAVAYSIHNNREIK